MGCHDPFDLSGNRMMEIYKLVEKNKGVVALDAKMFLDITRKLPDSDITIETDQSYKTSIKCNKSNFRIRRSLHISSSFKPSI